MYHVKSYSFFCFCYLKFCSIPRVSSSLKVFLETKSQFYNLQPRQNPDLMAARITLVELPYR